MSGMTEETDGPPVGADEDDLKLLTRLFDGPVRFHQDAGQTATRRALVREKDGSDEIYWYSGAS